MMCSVPGLPAPGSEVPVLITRVNVNPSCGLVELGVNMNEGRRSMYEQLREEIQIPQRTFYGREGQAGDLCLACVSGTWHRARIVSVGAETYRVFLIDQGQTHVATGDALAWGHSSQFLLPPQTESCVLANVLSLEGTWPERATKFLKSLSGKKFKAVVQCVLMPDRTVLLDLPTVSKHMCKFGIARSIPGEEFECLVLKCLRVPEGDASTAGTQEPDLKVNCRLEEHGPYFYPELLTDTFENVIVTEVVHPNNFFCVILIFSKAVNILAEQLQQFYEGSCDLGAGQPQTRGDPCAARGRDGKWRRSLLRRNVVAGDGAVEVLHVDDGKTEEVAVHDVRALHGRFLRMPVFTYVCSLSGVKENGTGWTTDQTDYLKSLLLNQTVVARFDNHTVSPDLYHVTVYAANGTCINDCFTETTAAPPPFKTTHDPVVQNDTLPFVSSLEDKNCKVGEEVQHPLDLHVDQNQVSNESEPPGKPNGESVTQEQHEAHSRDDASAANELMVSSRAATDSSAPEAELQETFDEQSRPSSDPSLEDKEAVTETSTASSYSDSEIARLSVPSCPEGNANVYKRPNVSEDEPEEVYASCVGGPGYVWCQFSNTEELNKLSRMAQEAGRAQLDKTCPETLDVGRPCLVLYSDDDRWYRAQVLQRTGDNIHVLFVDYGNESDVDIKNVRSLPESLLQTPPQAFLCSLSGFDESGGSWDDGVYDEFYNVLVDKPLRVTAVKVQDCSHIAVPQFTVKMECERVIVNDVMQKYWTAAAKQHVRQSPQPEVDPAPPHVSEQHVNNETAQTESSLHVCHTEAGVTHVSVWTGSVKSRVYKKPSVSKNETLEVYASVIVDPCFFWCQFANTELLSRVSTLAQEAGQPQGDRLHESLGPGSPCLAVFPSDNQWYRACVTQRTGESFHILFVDYGNESDVHVKDVRPLPPSLLDVAPQAFLCCLSGFDESSGSWNDRVYDEFFSVLADKPLRLTVLHMELHSELVVPQFVVQIQSENVIVNEAMQKYWRAAAAEGVKTERPEEEKTPTVLSDGPNADANVCSYKKPDVVMTQTHFVYVSCISEPSYFWCQFADTEGLSNVLTLAQEAGRARMDMRVLETLGPGSPCLALFSSDNQWYRAQVIQRTDDVLHVVFVDYGNESDVDVKNVRALPRTLLETPPQAFLCSLSGFDGSTGSWDEQVYDYFYSVVIDKALRVTGVNGEARSHAGVAQFEVELECDGVDVNTLVKKYWRESSVSGPG